MTVYGTASYEQAEVVVKKQGQEIYRETARISPVDIFEKEIIGDIVMTRIPEDWTGEEVF